MAVRYVAPLQTIASQLASLPDLLLNVANRLVDRAEAAQTAVELDDPPRHVPDRVAAALNAAGGSQHVDGPPTRDSAETGAGPGVPVPTPDEPVVTGAPAEAVHAAVTATGQDGATGAPERAGDAPHRATAHDLFGDAPPSPVPEADSAEPRDWACWMASHAAQEDVPPSLPIAMALAGSGMNNLGEHGGGCGFFGLRPGEDVAPPGFGVGPASRPDAEWWHENPDAQLDHVLRNLRAVAPENRDDADLARWATDANSAIGEGDVADAMSVARTLVARCRHALADPESPDTGGGASQFVGRVRGELGVAETAGANAGPEVDRYLAAADVGSGNPWCASFLTWAMRETGHEMPGTGWAAVATWVNAAQSGEAGLSVVPAEEARPGDIVAYDWGGGGDFGQDGHIGMLESTVEGGRFTTIEGNAEDAVTRMDRSLGEGNVVFLRREG